MCIGWFFGHLKENTISKDELQAMVILDKYLKNKIYCFEMFNQVFASRDYLLKWTRKIAYYVLLLY